MIQRVTPKLTRQRSFNWQSTAFVMRGLWVRLPPLAFHAIRLAQVSLQTCDPASAAFPRVSARSTPGVFDDARSSAPQLWQQRPASCSRSSAWHTRLRPTTRSTTTRRKPASIRCPIRCGYPTAGRWPTPPPGPTCGVRRFSKRSRPRFTADRCPSRSALRSTSPTTRPSRCGRSPFASGFASRSKPAPDARFEIRLTLIIPRGASKPVPAFVGMHLFESASDAPNPGRPLEVPPDEAQSIHEKLPGDKLLGVILARGYAVGTLDASDFCPDDAQQFRHGALETFFPDRSGPPGRPKGARSPPGPGASAERSTTWKPTRPSTPDAWP